MRPRWVIERLASGRLAIVLLSLLAVAAALGTLVPHEGAVAARGSAGVAAWLRSLGVTDVFGSRWFALLLGVLGVNLTCCLAARWSHWVQHRDSLVRHAGFLIVLLGGAVSALYAERGMIILPLGEDVETVVVDGAMRPLGYALRLVGFTLERHDPEAEQLLVRLAGEAQPRVYPVQLRREMPVEGTPYTLRVDRYVPDFVMATDTGDVVSRSPEPNNPAIHVQVESASDSFSEWVFAKPTGLHRDRSAPLELAYRWTPSRPKAYQSQIEVRRQAQLAETWLLSVNHPRRYRGRMFYQYSYDPERWGWSGILVKSDPGVPVVYTGFVLVFAGILYGSLRGRPSGDGAVMASADTQGQA